MVAVCIMQGALLSQAQHRLEAIEYTRSCADKLMSWHDWISYQDMYSWWNPPELAEGHHTAATDPDVCRLPDAYFKQFLNGTLEYNISAEILTYISEWNCDVGIVRAEITVKWDEKFPKAAHKEEKMFIIAAPYFFERSF
jgi:hypothetical protein